MRLCIALALLLALPMIQAQPAKEKPMRPNILLIMTDQQRFDQLGFSSGNYFETPRLDKLANSGVIFDCAYSASPICIPSRGSLMTGLAPHRYAKQPGYSQALKEGFWTVAHALQDAGYETMLAGKMHFVPIRSQHGFEKMRMAEHLGIVYGPEEFDDYTNWLVSKGKGDWRATHLFGPEEGQQKADFNKWCQAVPFGYSKEYHPTSWVAREAIEMLEKRDKARPYFMIVSFPHPHCPFDPPAPYDTMYDPADARLTTDSDRVNDGLPPSARELMQSEKAFGAVLNSKTDEAVQRRIATNIRALIHQIDDAVGEVLQHVDMNNTVVFFTSDHGDYYGRRGRWMKTPGVPFDDLARVPFFCAGAGVRPQNHRSDLVQSIDFAMTCLDVAGVKPPAGAEFDGESLVPLLQGETTATDRVVYCSSNYDWPMVRKGSLKYFRNTKNGEQMLFDLSKDPDETRNLISEADYEEPLRELRDAMSRELARGIPDLPRYPVK